VHPAVFARPPGKMLMLKNETKLSSTVVAVRDPDYQPRVGTIGRSRTCLGPFGEERNEAECLEGEDDEGPPTVRNCAMGCNRMPRCSEVAPNCTESLLLNDVCDEVCNVPQ
jgi:hypothetical protein